MSQIKTFVLTSLCATLCSACQSYYAVTDLRNNSLYYTQDNIWTMQRRHGGLQFEELFTGDVISLDSARAHKMTAGEVQEVIRSHRGAASKPSR